MTAKERYATPAAFRRALTDRLKELAKESRLTLQQPGTGTCGLRVVGAPAVAGACDTIAGQR